MTTITSMRVLWSKVRPACLTAMLLLAPARLFAPLQPTQTTPTRIFTPNGDGVNDSFTLTIQNPSASVLTQKKIFDVQGAEVADFRVIGNETDPVVTLSWDGRDGDGNLARSGIYIYQVQAENQVINGTIVVAR